MTQGEFHIHPFNTTDARTSFQDTIDEAIDWSYVSLRAVLWLSSTGYEQFLV